MADHSVKVTILTTQLSNLRRVFTALKEQISLLSAAIDRLGDRLDSAVTKMAELKNLINATKISVNTSPGRSAPASSKRSKSYEEEHPYLLSPQAPPIVPKIAGRMTFMEGFDKILSGLKTFRSMFLVVIAVIGAFKLLWNILTGFASVISDFTNKLGEFRVTTRGSNELAGKTSALADALGMDRNSIAEDALKMSVNPEVFWKQLDNYRRISSPEGAEGFAQNKGLQGYRGIRQMSDGQWESIKKANAPQTTGDSQQKLMYGMTREFNEAIRTLREAGNLFLHGLGMFILPVVLLFNRAVYALKMIADGFRQVVEWLADKLGIAVDKLNNAADKLGSAADKQLKAAGTYGGGQRTKKALDGAYGQPNDFEGYSRNIKRMGLM